MACACACEETFGPVAPLTVLKPGYGREGSTHGLDDYLHTKYIGQGQLD